MRPNPQTGKYSGYYRLVESYRKESNRVRHRTILNAGYLDDLSTEQLNLTQKILTKKVSNGNNKLLFETPYTDDAFVIQHVDEFYNRMVKEKHIDVINEDTDKKSSKKLSNKQTIYVDSIKNKDVREIGAEWMSFQALDQLQIGLFLKNEG
ncbi:MAG: hypothetical protein JW922_08975 [Paludibacteraceae bacterium]|nr:hypothetical protein [Paludibacteraceae bacterium]